MENTGFFTFFDEMDELEDLTDAEIGKTIRAKRAYAQSGELFDAGNDITLKMAFKIVKNRVDLMQRKNSVRREAQRLKGYLSQHDEYVTQVLLKKLIGATRNYNDLERFKNDFAEDYKRLDALLNPGKDPKEQTPDQNLSEESFCEPVPPADFEEYYPTEEELQESYEYLKEPIRDGYIHDKASLELYRSEIEQSGCDFDSLSGWLFNSTGSSNIGKPFCDVLESYKKHVGRR